MDSKATQRLADEAPKDLMTVPEVADTLRVSPATVYRLVEQRRLPFYRVSGVLRFSGTDLALYLSAGRVAAITELAYGNTQKK